MQCSRHEVRGATLFRSRSLNSPKAGSEVQRACSHQPEKENNVSYETATVPPRLNTEDSEAQISDCPDAGRIAVALLNYQMSCRCKSCLSELIITGLRKMHLYRNPPCGDVDPEEWRWSMAVCEPFTAIEAALLNTNDEQLIKLAYPAVASLVEKELRARYEEDLKFSHEVQERPRGISCVAATRH
jgi:hypothetical protein